MAQFRAFAPAVEVNGETVLSVVDGMGSFKAGAMKILDEMDQASRQLNEKLDLLCQQIEEAS